MSAAHNTHVIVGISGGVDSAVAAWLLLQQGYQVTGLFMQNWEAPDEDGVCTAEQDYKEAYKVCQHLGIPLHGVNFSKIYWERVFRHFLAECRAGRTPNPDVLCNQEIKFKAFLEHALARGADYIATGHYARVQHDQGHSLLLKGADADKDQTYFLYALGAPALRKTLFPVGALTKPQVRALAREARLPNHDRKDSTGICFIGERRFKRFLSEYLPAQPGDIRSLEGELKGRHDGLMYYTLGQRQGLGIGGPGGPWYVVDKDLGRNMLVVAQGEHHPALYHSSLTAGDLHWTAAAPTLPLACTARVRYRQTEQACRIFAGAAGALEVQFATAQRAITPGQSVVFYQGPLCLGGGVIQGVGAPAAVQAQWASNEFKNTSSSSTIQ